MLLHDLVIFTTPLPSNITARRLLSKHLLALLWSRSNTRQLRLSSLLHLTISLPSRAFEDLRLLAPIEHVDCELGFCLGLTLWSGKSLLNTTSLSRLCRKSILDPKTSSLAREISILRGSRWCILDITLSLQGLRSLEFKFVVKILSWFWGVRSSADKDILRSCGFRS